MMNRRLLLGIDLRGSPATQYALSAAGELLELRSWLGLVLLAVIPVPYIASRCPWVWGGTLRPVPPTYEQQSRPCTGREPHYKSRGLNLNASRRSFAQAFQQMSL